MCFNSTACFFLELNPVKVVHDVMVAITTEGMIEQELVMSQTVYLKNLINNVLKLSYAGREKDLVEILNFFV